MCIRDSPKEEWLKQVKTAKSRSQIKRAIEQQKIINARNSGRALLQRKLREKGEELSVEKWIKSMSVKSALKAEKLSANKFFQEIGLRKRPLQQFLRKYKLLHFESSGRLKEMINREFWGNIFGGNKNIFLIDDVQNPLINLASCCFPIPGDKISGFIHDDKEIEIHLIDCPNKINNKKLAKSKIIPIDVHGISQKKCP